MSKSMLAEQGEPPPHNHKMGCLMEELLKLATVALVDGIGPYFGAHLKKMGENLATHEDINRLVDQVSAVTKTKLHHNTSPRSYPRL